MDEKKSPIIYLDLDETLISTEFYSTEPKLTPEGSFTFKLGGYWYVTQVRWCALELIEFCRNISICRILTAATGDYAKLISDRFEFGFSVEEIIDRDQYVEWVEDGWSGWMNCSRETPVAKTCVEHVNAILVDNQTPDLPNAQVKIKYLGMHPDNYIVFPEWYGEAEEPHFPEQFELVKRMITSRVEDILKSKDS